MKTILIEYKTNESPVLFFISNAAGKASSETFFALWKFRGPTCVCFLRFERNKNLERNNFLFFGICNAKIDCLLLSIVYGAFAQAKKCVYKAIFGTWHADAEETVLVRLL